MRTLFHVVCGREYKCKTSCLLKCNLKDIKKMCKNLLKAVHVERGATTTFRELNKRKITDREELRRRLKESVCILFSEIFINSLW